ncbi:MAG: hypothetical protein KF718_28100 [Polyangiaceae bacterium]|nr:hypothetical protein [Polyangiaceae bacterium]
MHRLTRCFGLLAGAWLTAGPARAGEPIELEWSAPDGCPTRQDVLSRAAALLGQTESEQRILARGRIRAAEGEFELELETVTSDGTGRRRLRAGQCEELAQPAALLLALAVNPAVTAPEPAPPEPTPEPAALDSTPPAAAPAAPVAPPRGPRPAEGARESRWAARLGLGVAGDVGALPTPAPGIAGSVGAALGGTTLEARLTVLLEQRTEVGGGRGGAFTLTTGGLSACHDVAAAPVLLAPCLGVEVGRLSGAGFGVTEPGSGSALWVAGLAGLRGVEALTDGLGVWVGAELVVPVGRPEFVLENVGVVHRPARAGGRAAIGAEVRFP